MTRLIRIALNALCALALLAVVVFLLLYWKHIPDSVPMRYDMRGQVEGWGAKGTLFLLPALGAVLLVVLSFAKTIRVRSLGRERRLSAPPLLFPLIMLPLVLGLCYITVCSALLRPLGVWFLPTFLGTTLLPTLAATVWALRAAG